MTRWASVVAWTVQLELRRWLRQPLAVATAFVLPVAVAAIVTAAVGGDYDYETTWAVVDQDDGPVGDAFVDRALGAPPVRDLVTVRRTDEAEARRLVEAEDVSAAIILPEDLSERVGPDRGPRIEVLAPDDPWLGTDLAEVVVDAFAVQAWATVVRPDATTAGTAVGVVVEGAGGTRIDGATHFGPAIALFFVLLALGFGAQSAVTDRRNGTSDRLRVARAPAGASAVGRGVAGMLIGGLSLAVTGLALGLLFDRSWGPPGPVALLVLAVLFCFAGLAAVIARFARTATGVQIVTTGTAFLMAVASGSLSPPGSTERPAVGAYVPVGRAIDGFAALVTGGGLVDIAGDLAFLTVMGLALLALAVVPGTHRA